MSASFGGSAGEVLRVRNLSVWHRDTRTRLVGPVSFTLGAGECLALVGDSGSGKSLILKALMNLLPAGLRVTSDEFSVLGLPLRGPTERAWNTLRGATLALVQQDTGMALDPLKRIEAEVREAAQLAARRDGAARRALDPEWVASRLAEVGVSQPESLLRRWPHQLSGGQRQRVVLASSLSAHPRILLADEPTSALDQDVRDAVLDRLKTFIGAGGSVLLVSHDEAVVRELSSRVLFLEDGVLRERREKTVEGDERQRVSAHNAQSMRHPESVCVVQGLSAKYASGDGIAGINLTLRSGEIVGLLGQSGAGKTTLARAITGLVPGVQGAVTFGELDWLTLSERERRTHRARMQWIPQDALASFARGMTVANILDEAIRQQMRHSNASQHLARQVRRHRVLERRRVLLSMVGLDPSLAAAKPSRLSGGQRQRVAIARAIAAEPQLLICDEPISALDAHAREGILGLIVDLARQQGCAVLFISHDEHAVRRVSDHIVRLHNGRLADLDAPSETG